MIQKIKNSLRKRKVKLFLSFLSISTFAWLVSNLSEKYVSSTRLNLSYNNTDENWLLVKASHEDLWVKLEATGFQFLSFNFKNKEVVVDLQEAVQKNGKHYLPLDRYRSQIEKQLSNTMRIVQIERDTLFFDFQKLITKEVPVKPVTNITLAKNYILDGGLSVAPKKVVLKGPKNEIDTLTTIATDVINLIDLTTNFSEQVPLHFPNTLKNSTISTKMARISGTVSPFSEQLLKVPISPVNIPKGTAVKMFPQEVKLLCKGTLAALKNIKATDFEVTADFNALTRYDQQKISVVITQKPKSLLGVVLLEKEVEFILNRNR